VPHVDVKAKGRCFCSVCLSQAICHEVGLLCCDEIQKQCLLLTCLHRGPTRVSQSPSNEAGQEGLPSSRMIYNPNPCHDPYSSANTRLVNHVRTKGR